MGSRYSRRQMYSIVADVDSYESFVPFCSGSKVMSCHPPSTTKAWVVAGMEGDRYDLDAELRIGVMGFDESYISKVTCRKWDVVKVIGTVLIKLKRFNGKRLMP